jgi:hypothetical protein
MGCSPSKEVNKEEKVEQAPTVISTTEAQVPCDHSASVRFTKHKECGMLFTFPNGMMYEAKRIPDPESGINHGEKVRLSYRVIEDMSTDCELAKGVIEVTCLMLESQISDRGYICHDVNDPYDVLWIKSVMKDMDPTRVIKYDYREEKAYAFEKNGSVAYYDCRGTELYRGNQGEERAMIVLSQFSNAYVILVVNE